MYKRDPFPALKDAAFNNYTSNVICEKLKDYFIENGMKQSEIAYALDVTQAAISNQMNGRPFGINSAKKWSKLFGFTIDWLSTGEGPMFGSKKPINVLKADSDEIMHPKQHNDGEIPVIPAWMFRAHNVDTYKTIMEDPTVETLPAVPHFGPHDLFARCPGDAMAPKLRRGYLMALRKMDPDTAINNGEIYVVDSFSQGLIVRKIRDNYDGTLTCIPTNLDQFQPFNINKSDVINIFRIVGVLVTNIN